jgi:hypothetical protein
MVTYMYRAYDYSFDVYRFQKFQVEHFEVYKLIYCRSHKNESYNKM